MMIIPVFIHGGGGATLWIVALAVTITCFILSALLWSTNYYKEAAMYMLGVGILCSFLMYILWRLGK